MIRTPPMIRPLQWLLILIFLPIATRSAEPVPWPEPYLTYAYLQKSWETTGRLWMGHFAGFNWDDSAQDWRVDPQWAHRDYPAADAYYIQFAAEGAVSMASAAHDGQLVDELARFYNLYYGRFKTLGELRSRGPAARTGLRAHGDDAALTLPWRGGEGDNALVGENVLCSSQFFHPVCRLLRAISLLAPDEVTPAMRTFTTQYVPLVVRDNLIRILFEFEWDLTWGATLPAHRIESWEAIMAAKTPPRLSYQYAMLDRDLWLIANAAEILGANANAVALVKLTADENDRLRKVVQVGTAFFISKRSLHLDTEDRQGRVVGSACYFEGDFADHADAAYSGYTGKAFPAEKDRGSNPRGSWDSSHAGRIPLFLRSLYENKEASGNAFPGRHDLELVANQWVYKVYRGDPDRPLFNNYLDGGNGWERVGYHGGEFGYPPAEYADAHNPKRPSLITGELLGWGQLAPFNPDLLELEHSLAKLAWRSDPQTQRFKDQYYWYKWNSQAGGSPDYEFQNAQGEAQYPILLFFVLSQAPQMLQGCGRASAGH